MTRRILMAAIFAIALALAGALAGTYFGDRAEPPPRDKPAWPTVSAATPCEVSPLAPSETLCGWIDDGGHAALASGLPALSEAAPHLYAAPRPDRPDRPICLYAAWKQVFRDYPPYAPQEIGDCVSFGWGHGNDLLQTIECALGHLLVADIQETCTEFIYGASRAVGGLLGRQDGSYGSAAARACTTVGMVPRTSVGPYSGRRAREWGYSGPPEDLVRQAASYQLGGVARIESYEDILAALNAGFPVAECSLFLPDGRRDEQGFCLPSGRGPHCQLIVGARFDRPGLAILNQWPADYYSGPLTLGIPQNCYWVDREIVEREIVPSGDNYAMSGSPGFRPRRGIARFLQGAI